MSSVTGLPEWTIVAVLEASSVAMYTSVRVFRPSPKSDRRRAVSRGSRVPENSLCPVTRCGVHAAPNAVAPRNSKDFLNTIDAQWSSGQAIFPDNVCFQEGCPAGGQGAAPLGAKRRLGGLPLANPNPPEAFCLHLDDSTQEQQMRRGRSLSRKGTRSFGADWV